MPHNKKEISVQEQRKKHFNKYHEVKADYESYYRDVHRDIRDYISPNSARFTDEITSPNDGSREDDNIVNSTATIALRTLTSGIWSGVTDPTTEWFRMTIEDPVLKELASVKHYFDQVTKILLALLSKSNFYTAIVSTYRDIGAYGTGALQIESNFDKVFHFIPFTIGQYYIDTDANGEVIAVYREVPMLARNVIDKFGIENVSDRVKTMVQGDKVGGEWVGVLHVMEPNKDRDVSKLDSANKPFKSTYYEVKGDESEPPIRVSGYDEKPFAVSRWEVIGANAWGKGPGETALPDVKMLQQLELDKLEALGKQVDPALVAMAQAGDIAINTAAGGVTYQDPVNGNQGPILSPAYQVDVDINNVSVEIARVEDRINDIFFSALFLLLSRASRTPKTATEIIEIKQELLRLLGPVVQRQNPDLLFPILSRCYDLGNKAGVFPEPPDEIQGRDVKIEIMSLISQAQKLTIVGPIQQMIADIASMTQVWPEVRDKLNPDQAADEMAAARGVPSGVINSDEIVAQIRAQQEADIARAEEAAREQQAVDNAKTLSETDVSNPNALTAIAGGAA
jgi:hypothetical protein